MSTAGADRDVDDDEMPGPSRMTTSQPNTREVLVTETLVYTHPDNIREWTDDMWDLPDVRGPDITYYLLRTKACDLKDVACYKSLPSFNYLQSGWVGKVMVHKVRDDIVILKAEVGPSQGINKPNHHAWVSAEMCGRVLRAGCTCIVQPKFSGNAATKHGQKYEPAARDQFITETGLATTPCGTVVSVATPWLSASPGGLVEQTAILEVKGPFVVDCKELVCSGKYDVKEVGSTYVLAQNGPNGYYAQVQFQLYCTGRKLCYFYVWSVKSTILIEVPFDSVYVHECAPRLCKFYFGELLPELERRYARGELAVCRDYAAVCDL